MLAGLVVRTHAMEDDRWGFSMFRDVNVLRIRYAWVFPDGHREVHQTKKDLRGDARQISATNGRDFILGMGAARMMIGGYVDWAWAHRRPEGASGFEATMEYRRYDRGPWKREVLKAPG